MPKIIENVREQLLFEARRQIEENGYAKTTIRSVASACHIAVGTVYNYFPSKEILIASFMVEDWKECLETIQKIDSTKQETFFRGIYDALTSFMTKHQALFNDSAAEKPFAEAFPARHRQLRQQITQLILPQCGSAGQSAKESDLFFTAEFIAEALLTWTVAGIPFEQLYALLRKLI